MPLSVSRKQRGILQYRPGNNAAILEDKRPIPRPGVSDSYPWSTLTVKATMEAAGLKDDELH